MQKQLRTLILFITIFHLHSCSNKIENVIDFEQLPSTIPVVLSCSAYGDNIYEIRIFTINAIRKKTPLKRINLLLGGSVHYEDSVWQGGLIPYYVNNNELKVAESINLNFFTTKQIVLAYVVFIDTSNKYYPLLENDTKRLKNSRQDTIHLGTIEEIKAAKPVFFKEFIRVDSIALEFFYQDLFQYVLLPIEVK